MTRIERSGKKKSPDWAPGFASVQCGCLDTIQTKLKESNTEIVHTLLTGKVALMVQKADRKARKKPMTVLCNYCPFCGKKYPK